MKTSYQMKESCICCGRQVPEGRQICWCCEEDIYVKEDSGYQSEPFWMRQMRVPEWSLEDAERN